MTLLAECHGLQYLNMGCFYNPGNHNDNAGTYVNSNRTSSATIKNGHKDFTKSPIETFVIEEAINNPEPTGGVKIPIVKLIQMIIPK